MKLNPLTKLLLTAALALCQINTQAASHSPVAAEHSMGEPLETDH
jgi:hypothetical protein